MENPFAEISEKLDKVLTLLTQILENEETPADGNLIPFNTFCKRMNITRPTVYNWRAKGLLDVRTVGKRVYVLADSIKVQKKSERHEEFFFNGVAKNRKPVKR